MMRAVLDGLPVDRLKRMVGIDLECSRFGAGLVSYCLN